LRQQRHLSWMHRARSVLMLKSSLYPRAVEPPKLMFTHPSHQPHTLRCDRSQPFRDDDSMASHLHTCPTHNHESAQSPSHALLAGARSHVCVYVCVSERELCKVESRALGPGVEHTCIRATPRASVCGRRTTHSIRHTLLGTPAHEPRRLCG